MANVPGWETLMGAAIDAMDSTTMSAEQATERARLLLDMAREVRLASGKRDDDRGNGGAGKPKGKAPGSQGEGWR